MTQMRIGICCRVFMGWGGGLDLLRIIVQSLLAASSATPELHLILQDRGIRHSLGRGRAQFKRIMKRSLFRREVSSLIHGTAEEFLRGSLGDAQNRVHFHHIDSTRRALLLLSRSLSLDVLVPSAIPLGRDFPIPWVGYLYDFQHRYLSQYFTQKNCRDRDAAFAKMLREAKVVIVNARSVAGDAAKFFPSAAAEIFVMPFAAAPEPAWLESRPELAEKYGISTPYFMISNQFWIHKRHDVAFEAFHKVIKRNEALSLVCTGDTEDGRSPEYFGSLLAKLDSWGLRNKVKILGLIPKREQIELMKGAIAVIQPTAFEGGPGGGSVYDAVSVGTPAIVSDLPVNLEIAPLVWRFFRYGNVDSLADAMNEVVVNPPIRLGSKTLLAHGMQRRHDCGETVLAAVNRAIALANGVGR